MMNNELQFDIKKIKKEAKNKKTIIDVLIYTLLTIWALVVLFPFYWMMLTSVKSYKLYISELTPAVFINNPTLENYKTAFESVNLTRYMANTLIFALITTSLMAIVSILAAFAFARLNFKGKNLVFTIYLSLMMIPTELVVITNYVTAVSLDLRNTFTGLILPSVTSVFYIYLLKENFALVPDTLYQASKLDGCNDWNYLWKILVPINRPTVVSIIILKLIECWNSFVWPRLITNDSDYYLISNGIEQIKSHGFGRENIPAMMSAVVIISIPLIVLFLLFRRQIMAGVSKSGTKG